MSGGFGVQVRDLSVHYGRTVALNHVSLDVAAGSITGLLGRNGSGKTSLLSVLAAFRRPTSGTVLVDGEDPWENARVMAGTGLVRESGDLFDTRIAEIIDYTEQSREHFDRTLAEDLLDRFELDPCSNRRALSRGKKSALGVVLGIAARTELTMLDEVYLGMDAPSRYTFYDALLADYVAHPRTIVLSSHLIDEIDRLFEHVTILDSGALLLSEDADELRARGTTVTGPTESVEVFTAGRQVVGRQQLGRTTRVTVFGDPQPTDTERARGLGLELGPVDLQDLFVHLTGRSSSSTSGEPAPARASSPSTDPTSEVTR